MTPNRIVQHLPKIRCTDGTEGGFGPPEVFYFNDMEGLLGTPTAKVWVELRPDFVRFAQRPRADGGYELVVEVGGCKTPYVAGYMDRAVEGLEEVGRCS